MADKNEYSENVPLQEMAEIPHLMQQDEKKQAREKAEDLLRRYPREWALRLIACNVYSWLGLKAEAMSQLAIALALHPDNFAVHSKLAYLLDQNGDDIAAQEVLEAGWQHYKKHVSKQNMDQEKQRFFSLIKGHSPYEE